MYMHIIINMSDLNTYTNDTVITVSARVKSSTWTALRIRAAKEQKRISRVYDEALRLYLGLDAEEDHVIEEYRSSKTDKWVNTTVAEKETGIPAYRIRYLARTNQIDSKKLGQSKTLVRIVDLEPYKK